MILQLAEEVDPAAASVEPWWGTPAFTLGGLIIGAVLTPVVAYLIAARTRRQEAKEKSRAEASAAVLDFLNQSETYVTDLWQSDEAAIEKLNLAGTKVTLLCPPSIVEASLDVQIALEEYQREHRKLPENVTEAHYRALVNPFYKEFYALVNATRKEYGGVALPKPLVKRATTVPQLTDNAQSVSGESS